MRDGAMIRAKIRQDQVPMQDDDVALCERVFYGLCAKRGIDTEDQREELASSIIHAYQHGVRDEGTLMRLFD